MLFVSAHKPTEWLSCTQLFVMRAPCTAQNLPPPVQPQPGWRTSQSPVLFPMISLWSNTTSVMPSPPW